MEVQGSQLYVLDPTTHLAVQVSCPTNVDMDPGNRDQIELQCISRKERKFRAGMANPGKCTAPINYEPADPSHQLLRSLYASGETTWFAFGYSDGMDVAPTAEQDSAGEYSLTGPTTRSWEIFEGYVDGFPRSAPYNGEVGSNVSIQISGAITSIDKVTP